MTVAEIEDITLFCSLISTPGLGIGHQPGNTREFLHKSSIVTRSYHAFAVYINDVVTHHLAGTYLPQRRKFSAYELYKFWSTSHKLT